jgi:hypothetical protein
MRTVPLLALLPLLAAVPSAHAKPVRDLWATVNVCDTKDSPDRMGVRARMPGDGTRRHMYMRFTAEFRDGKKWKRVNGRGRSKWLLAGTALFRNQELGYTFSFDAPKAGTSYLMRGLVQYEWRAPTSGSVVRRTHRYTTKGHPTEPADPKGFSRATCRIATPKASSDGG